MFEIKESLENDRKKVLASGMLMGSKKPVKNDLKLLDDKIKADWSKKKGE